MGNFFKERKIRKIIGEKIEILEKEFEKWVEIGDHSRAEENIKSRKTLIKIESEIINEILL